LITVEGIAGNIATSIIKNNPETSSSYEVLKYGIIAFLNQVIITCSVLFFGAITGHLLESFIAVIAFPIIRYFSGGVHLGSSMWCNLVTTTIVLLSVYTPIEYWYNGLVINAIALLIISVTAPSGIKRSRIDQKYYPLLKIISMVIIAINFAIQSPVLSVVFFIQSLTTLRIFYKILEK
jgi:accessory gene regulator B